MRWFGWLREPDYSWPNPPRPLAEGEVLCTDQGVSMYSTFRNCLWRSGCGRVCDKQTWREREEATRMMVKRYETTEMRHRMKPQRWTYAFAR